MFTDGLLQHARCFPCIYRCAAECSYEVGLMMIRVDGRVTVVLHLDWLGGHVLSFGTSSLCMGVLATKTASPVAALFLN